MNGILHFPLRLALIGLLAWLPACGGGSGGGESAPVSSSPASPSPAPPADPAAPSERGQLMLYVTVAGDSRSDYDPYTGITIRTNTQHLVRFIPALQQVAIVATNASADFAASSLHAYTTDDRLFLRTEREAETATGSHTLLEQHPLSHAPLMPLPGTRLMNAPYSSGIGCSAVVGNRYYYRASTGTDVFGRRWGGELRVADLRQPLATSSLLVARDDPDNCKGALHAAAGQLYDAQVAPVGGAVSLFQRDLTTGRIARTWTFTLPNAGSFRLADHRFAFEDGVGYVARRRSDGLIQLWRIALREDPADTTAPVLLDEVLAEGLTLTHMDADDGWVAVGGNRQVLAHDTNSARSSLYQMPFDFYGMQVLHLRP